MNFFNKKVYFRILSFILIITTFFPLLSNNLPRFIGSFHLWILIWGISLVIFNSSVLENKNVIRVLVYSLFILGGLFSFWIGVRDWDKTQISYEIYYIVTSISVFAYYLHSKDYKGLKLLIKWTMFFIVITSVMSIYSASVDPMYARNFIGGDFSSPSELKYFKRLGGGAYDFASALLCFFPVAIYYYKNNEVSIFSKKIILLFIILLFYTLLQMQIFANILLAPVIIILSLLGSTRIKRSLLVIGFLTLFAIVIPRDFYIQVLNFASNYFDPQSHTYFKIIDMREYLSESNSENTAAAYRAARYPLLINAFVRNPFFGYYLSDGKVFIGHGGHLYWMNRLAVYGLLGFIPYVILHYKVIKSNLKLFDREFAFYYLLSVGVIIILGLMKSLAGRSLWFTFFFVLPGTYFLRKDK